MAYRKVTVDLSTAHDRLELVAPGLALDALTVLALPDGAELDLAWGLTGDFLPVPCVGFGADFCPAETGGLYARIPAGQSGEAVVYVGYAGGAQ